MKPSLPKEREEFAARLAKIIASNKPICYIDETAFSNLGRCRKAKTWTIQGKTNKPAESGFNYSVTVFGAIGKCLRKPVYFLARSTNRSDFLTFLKLVKD